MTLDPKRPFANLPSWEAIEGLSLVLDERARQLSQEGYTPEHDDEHTEGQLALLAAAYALSSRGSLNEAYEVAFHPAIQDWAFHPAGGTKAGAIKDLTRAGALILAELERRLRMEK